MSTQAITSRVADDYIPDGLEDTSMLLAWTDAEGRFFCHADDGRVIELCDDDPIPAHIVTQAAATERVSRRLDIATYALLAFGVLMFAGQFVRAWLAGLL